MILKKRCILCENRISRAASVWDDRLICICEDCMREVDEDRAKRIIDTPPSITSVIPIVYYDGKIREAIKKFKFDGHRGYGKAFEFIARTKLDTLWDEYMHDAIVTMPLSKERMRERGFNQSRFLSDALSRALGIPVRDDYLEKVVDTKPQSLLKYADRKLNIAGAYCVGGDVRGKNLILVDDIYTTGSTCGEAASTLMQNGARAVMAVVFAARRRLSR